MQTITSKLNEIEKKIQFTTLIYQAMEAGLSFGLDKIKEEDFKEEYERILKQLAILL